MLQKIQQAGGLGIVGLRRTVVLHWMARKDWKLPMTFLFIQGQEGGSAARMEGMRGRGWS